MMVIFWLLLMYIVFRLNWLLWVCSLLSSVVVIWVLVILNGWLSAIVLLCMLSLL